MLKIENLLHITGKEFTLANGSTYIVGMAVDEGNHYSFAVFPLMQNKVANIKENIIFELSKDLYDNGITIGYTLSSSQMSRLARVTPRNLTLENFVLELHIQTGMIVNKR